jgi:hypothetical protein
VCRRLGLWWSEHRCRYGPGGGGEYLETWGGIEKSVAEIVEIGGFGCFVVIVKGRRTVVDGVDGQSALSGVGFTAPASVRWI